MILAALAVTIPLLVGECVVESAVVTHVPPSLVHVITVSECGGLQKCWTRVVESDGKKISETTVCAGYDSSFQVYPK